VGPDPNHLCQPHPPSLCGELFSLKQAWYCNAGTLRERTGTHGIWLCPHETINLACCDSARALSIIINHSATSKLLVVGSMDRGALSPFVVSSSTRFRPAPRWRRPYRDQDRSFLLRSAAKRTLKDRGLSVRHGCNLTIMRFDYYLLPIETACLIQRQVKSTCIMGIKTAHAVGIQMHTVSIKMHGHVQELPSFLFGEYTKIVLAK